MRIVSVAAPFRSPPSTSALTARSASVRASGFAVIAAPWYREIHRGREGLTRLERLAEVRDELVRVLDADGVADEVVLHADRLSLLRRELVEAHERGLLDEALHAAEARRDLGDRRRVHDAARADEIRIDLERHDATEARH